MESLQGVTLQAQEQPLELLEKQKATTAAQLSRCTEEIAKVKAGAREAIEEVAVGLRRQWQSSLSQHMDKVREGRNAYICGAIHCMSDC